ncbi:FAD-dependent oxidoreductase domain-containing protein 1, partial [Intoshia linei]
MGKLKLSFSRLTRRFKSKDIENINENVSVSTRKVQLNVLPTVPRPFTYKPISTYFDKNKPFSFGKFRFDKECDFMIIGAGLMGSLMAYRLLENNINPDYKIIIVDKDLKLKNSSSAASLGLIRQRFKNEIYNKMANESFDFMYNFTTNDVNNRLTSRDTLRFHPEDHLILFDYSNKNDLDKIQNSDAMNITLSPKSIDNNYPFLNVKDLLAGNIGFENEGWIDPQYLISELHRHNDTKEVVHLQGEVVGFETETDQSNQANERIKFTNIKLEDGNVYSIMSSHIINCSGAASRSIVDITNDASINKIFNLDYPVTARRTYYYVLKCIDEGYDMEKNWLKMPVIYDPSGFTL